MNKLILSIFLGFILCLQASNDDSKRSDFLTLRKYLPLTPDEREKGYVKNKEERAILQRLRGRFQSYFSKDHPIYRISPRITGRLTIYNKANKIGMDLDTLPLEWDFKLAKRSFSLGERDLGNPDGS